MKIRERESIERKRKEGKAYESKEMGKYLKAKEGEAYKRKRHMKESGGGVKLAELKSQLGIYR